eukprot:5076569-Pleurochrysis_carterae.AAC.1
MHRSLHAKHNASAPERCAFQVSAVSLAARARSARLRRGPGAEARCGPRALHTKGTKDACVSTAGLRRACARLRRMAASAEAHKCA